MIVWISSYPRSGNTFLRIILNNCFGLKTFSIYNDLYDIGADKKTSELVGHLFLDSDFDLKDLRDSSKIYYVKTHTTWQSEMLKDKIIYLVRDGREATVSFKKYLEKYTTENYSHIEIIGGCTFAGVWSSHVRGYANRENTLVIKFEDLIISPKTHIEKLSDFIDLKPTKKTVPSFEELHSINPTFFRSGKKDTWKQELNEHEHTYFWYKNEDVMLDLGYHTDIPNVFKMQNADSIRMTTKIFISELDNRFLIIQSQLKKQLDEKDLRIQKLNEAIQEKEKKIDSIYGSITYRFGNLFLWPIKQIVKLFARKRLEN